MCRILDAKLVSLTRLRFTGKAVDQKQMDQREQKFKGVAQAAAAAAKKREKKKKALCMTPPPLRKSETRDSVTLTNQLAWSAHLGWRQ